MNKKYDGTVSDGYHTFDELYEHRMVLFSCLVNSTNPLITWKSKLHADGTMYNNYFIVGIETCFGQATYHYPMKDWDKFICKELPFAPHYDGHTPEEAIGRLLQHYQLENGNARIRAINNSDIVYGWRLRTFDEKKALLKRCCILLAVLITSIIFNNYFK